MQSAYFIFTALKKCLFHINDSIRVTYTHQFDGLKSKFFIFVFFTVFTFCGHYLKTVVDYFYRIFKSWVCGEYIRDYNNILEN